MCVVSPFSESLGLTYVQALKNPPLDKNTGLQPVFSITVDDPQKVGSPINTYTMYTVHTRVSTPLRSEPCEVPKSPRRLPLSTADPPSPSSVDTQTSYGSTKHFLRTTQGSLSLQSRKRTLSAGLTISSYNSGG
jgi:hypothetical protein